MLHNNKPALTKQVDKIPRGRGWLHEVKYDGYRILSYLEKGTVQLRSRNDQDWTFRFENIAESLKKIKNKSAVLDGEIIVLDKNGISSFAGLQNHLSNKAKKGFIYIIFDILRLDDVDLRERPLLERKKILKELLDDLDDQHIYFAPYRTAHGGETYRVACRKNSEGVISKAIDSPYPSSRNGDWVKTKCRNEDEFVISGFTDPAGARVGFGALLLGYWKNAKLIYCGRVGTGFNSSSLKSITKKLREQEIPESIFANELSRQEMKAVHYTRPRYVAQIKYTEWTSDGRLRQPVFLGLRQDKSSNEVKRAA